jgi:hypothetical protein
MPICGAKMPIYLELGLADASLVVLASRWRTRRILTLDERARSAPSRRCREAHQDGLVVRMDVLEQDRQLASHVDQPSRD